MTQPDQSCDELSPEEVEMLRAVWDVQNDPDQRGKLSRVGPHSLATALFRKSNEPKLSCQDDRVLRMSKLLRCRYVAKPENATGLIVHSKVTQKGITLLESLSV